ncbi:hypothetical protein INR49_007795 [Caranx melampygus]|nr:hypothetical protein INR49_007795 [Caranx melampygus]
MEGSLVPTMNPASPIILLLTYSLDHSCHFREHIHGFRPSRDISDSLSVDCDVEVLNQNVIQNQFFEETSMESGYGPLLLRGKAEAADTRVNKSKRSAMIPLRPRFQAAKDRAAVKGGGNLEHGIVVMETAADIGHSHPLLYDCYSGDHIITTQDLCGNKVAYLVEERKEKCGVQTKNSV